MFPLSLSWQYLTVQIVDLIRSDLHNISPSTSIKVPKLLHVESYETVHQVRTLLPMYHFLS
jgi:para-aminobenzoate synthetase